MLTAEFEKYFNEWWCQTSNRKNFSERAAGEYWNYISWLLKNYFGPQDDIVVQNACKIWPKDHEIDWGIIELYDDYEITRNIYRGFWRATWPKWHYEQKLNLCFRHLFLPDIFSLYEKGRTLKAPKSLCSKNLLWSSKSLNHFKSNMMESK